MEEIFEIALRQAVSAKTIDDYLALAYMRGVLDETLNANPSDDFEDALLDLDEIIGWDFSATYSWDRVRWSIFKASNPMINLDVYFGMSKTVSQGEAEGLTQTNLVPRLEAAFRAAESALPESDLL